MSRLYSSGYNTYICGQPRYNTISTFNPYLFRNYLKCSIYRSRHMAFSRRRAPPPPDSLIEFYTKKYITLYGYRDPWEIGREANEIPNIHMTVFFCCKNSHTYGYIIIYACGSGLLLWVNTPPKLFTNAL